MSLTLKWKEIEGQGQVRWFMRGISDEGRFYGEITRDSSRTQVDIEGELDAAEIRKVQENARQIGTSRFDPREGWRGLLAEGPIQNPTILLHYVDGDEAITPSAKLFLEIVEILKRHIRPESN